MPESPRRPPSRASAGTSRSAGSPSRPARPAASTKGRSGASAPSKGAAKSTAKATGTKAAPKPPRKQPRADKVKGRYGTVDLSGMGWMRRRRMERKYGLRKRNVIWRLRRPAFVAFLAVILASSGVAYSYWQIPLPDSVPPLAEISFMCSAEVIGDCTEENSIAQLSGDEKRRIVTYDEVPQILVQAVLAIEDRDYFTHQGVDPSGIARAFRSEVFNDDLKSGGSTITQQYIKNTYLSSERTLDRKIREAVLAIKIEKELSKQTILERYLNTIYFGRGAYGVAEAARVYFGKDLSQVALPEAAFLAGIIQSPEAYDPNRPSTDPFAATQRQSATRRRTEVLDAMVSERYINANDKEIVDALGWDYVVQREPSKNFGRIAHIELGSEYWIEYVRHFLTTKTPITDAQMFAGGRRIYTTIDWNAQQAAYDSIREILNYPDDPAASIVMVDQGGYVRTMVGGFDFAASQVNLAAGVDGGGSGRQPGSSFKPFALAAALESGMSLSKMYDAPGRLSLKRKDDGTTWNVANYGDAALGTMDLVQGTMRSSNTLYAQLINDVGVTNVIDVAKKMGVTATLPPYPSVVLGSGDVSVLDMASGFHTFANHGMKVGPIVVTKVTNAKGQLVWEPNMEPEQVIRPDTADAVNWVMSQVVEGGTGTAANYGQPAAGKTGTTEDYRDAWFVGLSCNLSAATWLGYPGPERRYMNNVHGIQVAGGTLPTRLWAQFMSKINQGKVDCPVFPRPAIAPSSGISFAQTNDTYVEVPGTTEATTPGSTPGSSPGTTTSPTNPGTTTNTNPGTVTQPTTSTPTTEDTVTTPTTGDSSSTTAAPP